MARKRVSPNQCRGKYKKKKRPLNHWEKVNHDTKGDASPPVLTSPSPVEGSRVINMKLLDSFVKEVSLHTSTCKDGAVSLFDESCRSGLASVLCARCSGCDLEMSFPTSSKITGLSGRQRWEVNLAAVWGQMATGGGYAPLQEQMSVLGVPVMTKRSFLKTEKVLGGWWS